MRGRADARREGDRPGLVGALAAPSGAGRSGRQGCGDRGVGRVGPAASGHGPRDELAQMAREAARAEEAPRGRGVRAPRSRCAQEARAGTRPWRRREPRTRQAGRDDAGLEVLPSRRGPRATGRARGPSAGPRRQAQARQRVRSRPSRADADGRGGGQGAGAGPGARVRRRAREAPRAEVHGSVAVAGAEAPGRRGGQPGRGGGPGRCIKAGAERGGAAGRG